MLRKLVKRLSNHDARACRELIVEDLGLANLGKGVVVPDDVTFIVLKLSFKDKRILTDGRRREVA